MDFTLPNPMKNNLQLLAVSVVLACAPFAARAADAEKAFAKADGNSDGKVSKAEFLAMGKAKNDEAKAKAEKSFARRDKDGDGFLSKEEFTATTGGKGGKKKNKN